MFRGGRSFIPRQGGRRFPHRRCRRCGNRRPPTRNKINSARGFFPVASRTGSTGIGGFPAWNCPIPTTCSASRRAQPQGPPGRRHGPAHRRGRHGAVHRPLPQGGHRPARRGAGDGHPRPPGADEGHGRAPRRHPRLAQGAQPAHARAGERPSTPPPRSPPSRTSTPLQAQESAPAPRSPGRRASSRSPSCSGRRTPPPTRWPPPRLTWAANTRRRRQEPSRSRSQGPRRPSPAPATSSRSASATTRMPAPACGALPEGRRRSPPRSSPARTPPRRRSSRTTSSGASRSRRPRATACSRCAGARRSSSS
jgi:hypothetical protein